MPEWTEAYIVASMLVCDECLEEYPECEDCGYAFAIEDMVFCSKGTHLCDECYVKSLEELERSD